QLSLHTSYLQSFPTRRSSDLQCAVAKPRGLSMNRVAADVRRLVPFRLKEVGASSRRLLRFRGLTREISGKSLPDGGRGRVNDVLDRKSTRLNSSHVASSYAVF